MWAMRIVHEASMHENDVGNCFVTLTYRDKYDCTDRQLEKGYHVPDDWSLHKSHFQKFIRRLREAVPHRVRYFHCGEYGRHCEHCPPGCEVEGRHCVWCNVGRPHYHAVLFNCRFDDAVCVGSRNGVQYFTSPSLEKLWRYGYVQVGEVNFASAAYVGRYCLKKVTGVGS